MGKCYVFMSICSDNLPEHVYASVYYAQPIFICIKSISIYVLSECLRNRYRIKAAGMFNAKTMVNKIFV
jgi:hypothetical protein